MADFMSLIGTWLAVFFTLGLFTILYRENFWYRIAESMYLGLAVGYGVALDMRYVRDQWGGQWSSSTTMVFGFALAFIVGMIWYFRFSRRYFYFYRWTLSIIVGTGIGMALRTVIFAQFVSQIVAQSRLVLWAPANPLLMFNNILIFIMVPAVLLYFWFTGAESRPSSMKVVDRIARYTMMAGFGSAFGYTILTRYSMFIGRAQFLLGVTPNPPEALAAFITISVVMLATMMGWDVYKRGKT